jgi:hypothetical protein
LKGRLVLPPHAAESGEGEAFKESKRPARVQSACRRARAANYARSFSRDVDCVGKRTTHCDRTIMLLEGLSSGKRPKYGKSPGSDGAHGTCYERPFGTVFS